MHMLKKVYEKFHYESRIYKSKTQNLHIPMDMILKFFLMNC